VDENGNNKRKPTYKKVNRKIKVRTRTMLLNALKNKASAPGELSRNQQSKPATIAARTYLHATDKTDKRESRNGLPAYDKPGPASRHKEQVHARATRRVPNDSPMTKSVAVTTISNKPHRNQRSAPPLDR